MKGKLEDFIDQNINDLNYRTPNPEVLERINRQLQQDQKSKTTKLRFPALWWSTAACLLLATGITIWQVNKSNTPHPVNPAKFSAKGQRHLQDTTKESQDAGNKNPVVSVHEPIERETGPVKHSATVQKKRPEQKSDYQNLLAGLQNLDSPADRIQALFRIDQLKALNANMVDVLVKTMTKDPNTNVRLTAFERLTKYHQDPYVKQQLSEALSHQEDPMVQIALISLLTQMKEKNILPQLERMLADANTIDLVKETIFKGIFDLRGS